MAEFGAKHPCFKPNTATAGVVIGKLVSANLTVNLATGELYADDELAEQLSEFISGSMAMETDDMADDTASIIYDAKVEDGEVCYNIGDTPPEGVLAYYKVLMRRGIKLFKGFAYPRSRAALGNDNAQTKGSNITFQTSQTTFTIFSDSKGNWRRTKEFKDEASAIAWVESKCNVSEYFHVDVSVQGTGAGKSADKSGTYYIAKDGSFTLNVEGYANLKAAYDNGTDISTTISNGEGTYTIAKVTENHTIAIVF